MIPFRQLYITFIEKGITYIGADAWLNNLDWHSHLRKWYLFGKLKKSVNIKRPFIIILCIYYISKWIWPFKLFWAIIASLTSRFDINTNFDASKQNQMIWLSVDCCCCVLYCPKHFGREKVWLIRFFFSQKNRHDVRLHCTKYLYFH